mmetsp:Transcript_43124/g.103327  ORF Transcript_43124/g.103327 Transcript_43124/m.103327 type:complete len:208 (+) Transcript_43124:1402-2025(+)
MLDPAALERLNGELSVAPHSDQCVCHAIHQGRSHEASVRDEDIHAIPLASKVVEQLRVQILSEAKGMQSAGKLGTLVASVLLQCREVPARGLNVGNAVGEQQHRCRGAWPRGPAQELHASLQPIPQVGLSIGMEALQGLLRRALPPTAHGGELQHCGGLVGVGHDGQAVTVPERVHHRLHRVPHDVQHAELRGPFFLSRLHDRNLLH